MNEFSKVLQKLNWINIVVIKLAPSKQTSGIVKYEFFSLLIDITK